MVLLYTIYLSYACMSTVGAFLLGVVANLYRHQRQQFLRRSRWTSSAQYAEQQQQQRQQKQKQKQKRGNLRLFGVSPLAKAVRSGLKAMPIPGSTAKRRLPRRGTVVLGVQDVVHSSWGSIGEH